MLYDLDGNVMTCIEPSNIYGKTVYMLGDSNADNWASGFAADLCERYLCKVSSFGTYGATWGDSDGEESTTLKTAIGQYNKMVAQIGIDSSTKLFPSDAVFLTMMGTNTATAGIGTTSDTGVDTDLGAANWVLKRLRYYGRANAIGVFLPWSCAADKKAGLITLCEYYKIPYFDIEAIICANGPTSEFAEQNYMTDNGVHLAANGWKAFERIAYPWIAHCI